MGYKSALKAAGATVLKFKEYGFYGGIWVAKINDGEYIKADYGSCSGCDAYEAEFEDVSTTMYVTKETLAKLASFGRSYLNLSQTKEELIEELKAEQEYREEYKEILEDLNKGIL